MEVKLISSAAELVKYREKILELEKHPWTNTLFTSYQWIENWIDSYPANGNLSIILIFDQNELKSFFPLMTVESSSLKIKARRMEFVSLSSHGDIICPRWHGLVNKLGGKLLSFLAENPIPWDYLYIQNMSSRAPCVKRLIGYCRENGFRIETGHLVENQRSWYVPLRTDWQSYYSSLSRNMRQSIKNKMNRLKRDGKVEIVHSDSLESISEMWQGILEVDKKTWQYESGTGLSSPKNALFYENIVKTYSDRGLDLWLLKLNGIPVAFSVSIIYNNKVYGMRWGFHKDYNRYSPAKVLLAEMIKHFIEMNYTEYDMLGKFDEFKSKWTSFCRQQVEIMIFNKTRKARLIHGLKFNRPLKSIIRPVRTRMAAEFNS